MEKQKKVIDASVIVKWFSNEIDSHKALKLRKDHINGKILLVVPELVFIEVVNALRYKGINTEKLLEINNSLWEIQLKVEPTKPFILEKSINVALKHNLSIYDSLYIVLAQIFGIELITADSELYKIPNVIPLEKI